METSALLTALQKADSERTNEEWIASLSQRKIEELKFHDVDWDESITVAQTPEEYRKAHGNLKYYSTVQLSQSFHDKWVRDHSPGLVVLDYACGNGKFALQAARAGAKLAIGLDISRTGIENCRGKAAAEGLSSNIFFIQGDCENTGLPDNSADTIVCSEMLHHLDLSYAFPELRRIMKPGGSCLCIEALNYNPAIKLYRKLTPQLRTRWEEQHILSLADLSFARRFFEVRNLRYWHLLSVLTTPFRNTRVFRRVLTIADALDSFILRVPVISLMAWQFSFVLVKPKEA